jgi:hypothetical protein
MIKRRDFMGVLSLVLVPAFAGDGDSYTGEEGTARKEVHGHWLQKMDKDGDGKINQKECSRDNSKKTKDPMSSIN